MRAKRISSDEQLRLIMECRQSGLSDYQWCRMHDINPGTFYNWISRLRKQGTQIPEPCPPASSSSMRQEVVKVELIPDHNACCTQLEQNALADPMQPAVEILAGKASVRLFNGADQQLVEAVLKSLGGILYAG